MTKEEQYKDLYLWVKSLPAAVRNLGVDTFIQGIEDRFEQVEIDLIKLICQNIEKEEEPYVYNYMPLGEVEKWHILDTLRKEDGNLLLTARVLRITQSALVKKLMSYSSSYACRILIQRERPLKLTR